MQCFNHPEKAAIGICKACNKGLCAECASDLGHGLACRGIHEQKVEALQALFKQSVRIYAAAPRARWFGPLFFLTMGLCMAGFSFFHERGWGLGALIGPTFRTRFMNKSAGIEGRERR